jgi:hypothetical protein
MDNYDVSKVTKDMFLNFLTALSAEIKRAADPAVVRKVIELTDYYNDKPMLSTEGTLSENAYNFLHECMYLSNYSKIHEIKQFMQAITKKSGLGSVIGLMPVPSTTEDNGSSETSKHYKSFGSAEEQPIVVMMRSIPRKDFSAYLECSFMKYNMRNGKKSGTNDTGKAMQYAKWYFEFKRNFGITVDGQFVRA